ncbi:MAG: Alpha,alpha-trehalose-phosphate synthase (UDP-forming) [Candidatus Gottesmanbacteria bacterium GW2011_GWC2_39_8]|uniref:Alpha,alpha-trehalose-phosphate synthase (UDP-forming) n=1 Tax=Candidatus Gottesmanbacteria bacterium GW2011_GWC2_39_8 TaxID=1618450 RepID=A0A0G0S911_9BACT|nr:MAG: Alpha,alpha-trehalose-phosphate synthase (UDP-forming) [Candidatus Gottesmanbacteria bacterium GW2011_GWC2_39_8]
MKQIFAAIFLITVIVTLIAVSFTFNQASNEEKRLRNDIQYRSTLLAESLRETIEPNFINKSEKYLQDVVEKYANKERFAGLAIIDNKGNIIAVSSTLPKEMPDAAKITADVMDSDKANGDFSSFKEKKMYIFAVPLHDDKSVVGSLMVVQNAGYIDTRLNEIWRNTLIRLFTQVLLLSIATILIIRWIIFSPVKNIVESIETARLNNNPDSSNKIPAYPFFQPLVKEVNKIQRSLIEARLTASEEARLRLEKLDSPWTSERLKEFVKDILKGRNIFVVSNREPYIHTRNGNKIDYFFPASGMVTAIEPIMESCGGTWVAHGSGNADKEVVDKGDEIRVPPNEPKYNLRRVWLTPNEEKGYYYGFSNEGLWPLCHIAHTRPIFRKDDWEQYRIVNGKFAKVVLEEIRKDRQPIIFIQDYHFALLPRIIKKSRPDALIGLFWHIPWPNSESFSICPFRKELLDGMLGADIVAFHTQLHCNNFIDTIGHELESLIDWEQFAVTRSRHTSFIKPFPISIAFTNGFKREHDSAEDNQNIIKNLHIRGKYIGLGVDRLDYTKGILEKFKAIELFLEKYPKYQNLFTFIQIAPPTRSKIKRYMDFENEVTQESERINRKYRSGDWKPIIFIKKRHSHGELDFYYSKANVCLVTSLHDGMNLVAKEYIAARSDEKGVLILSQFTGASSELRDALIINPYDADQTAEALHTALEMTPIEQIKRMKKLRETIKDHNVYRWSAEFLKTMVRLG